MTKKLILLAILISMYVGSAAADPSVSGQMPAGTVGFSQAEDIQPQLDKAAALYLEGKFDAALSQAQAFAETNPESALAYELIGAALMAQQDYAAAAIALAKSVELDDTRSSAWIRYGQTALESGNLPAAQERFESVVKRWPDLGAGHRNLALAYFRQRKLNEAFEQIEKALALNEALDLDALYLKASFLHEMTRHSEAERLLEIVLKESPNHGQAQLLQAMVKLDLKKWDEARPLIDQVLARDPQSAWARFGQAVLERHSGNQGTSKKMMQDLIAEHPQWLLLRRELAEIVLMEKNINRALDSLREFVEHSPNRDFATVMAGRMLFRYGYYEQSYDWAAQVLNSPDEQAALEAYRLWMDSMRQFGGNEQVERELLEYARTKKGTPYLTEMSLAGFYMNAGQPASARKHYDKAAHMRPDSVDPVMGQAETLKESGRKEEALEMARKAISMDDGFRTHFYLAQLHQQIGDPGRAFAAYKQFLEDNPGNISARIALSRAYVEKDNYEEAVKVLTFPKNVTDPQAAVLLYETAKIYHQTNRFERAVEAYEKAVKLDDNMPMALNNLAFLLSHRITNETDALERATAYAERAHVLAPQAPDVLDTLGWIYGRVGRLEEAEKLIQKAVDSDPERLDYRYHLGYVLAKKGDESGAVRELMRATNSGKKFPEYDKARALLDSYQ